MGDVFDLNTYLESVRGQGALDSEGEFTLAAREARRKLRTFQLARPELYAVHIVAAAVALGASSFRVMTYHDAVVLSFDGDEPAAAELDQMLSCLTSGGGKSWQREMAIGVNGALAFEPTNVTVDTWFEGEGTSLAFCGDEMVLKRRREPWEQGASGTRVRVELGFDWRRSLKRLYSDPPELAVMLSMCRHAPLELSVDVQVVNLPVALGTHSATALAWLFLPGQGPAELRVREPHPDSSPGCTCEIVEGERDFSALLVLEAPATAENRGLTVVVHGVSFRRPNTVLGSPLACGVVSAPFLKKNISQTDLAENEEYQGLLEELRRLVQELLVRRCEHSLPVPMAAGKYLAEAVQNQFGDDPPAGVKRWLHTWHMQQKSSDAESFNQLLAGLQGFDEAEARQLEQELFQTQLYFLRLSWVEPDTSLKRIELAERLRRLPHLEQLACPDELELIAAAEHWSGHVRPWPERQVAWNLHRRALAFRLAGLWEQARELHEQDTSSAWGAYLQGELALTRGDPRSAVASFDRAESRAGWAFVHDARASLMATQGRGYDAYLARVRAYQTRKDSGDLLLWVQYVRDQAQGVSSFPEWVAWSARASLAGLRAMTPEEERLYRLAAREGGHATLSRWREAQQRLQTRPMASAASRYAFWKLYHLLRSRGDHPEADGLLCRRLLRASFRFEGARIVAGEPIPQVL